MHVTALTMPNMARRITKRKRESLKERGASAVFLPDHLEQVKAIAMKGLSDDEMAEVFGISPALIQRWKEFYPSFEKAIEKGRTSADSRVVQALFERAIGYQHPEIRTFYDHEDGVIEHEVTKHLPPDMTAIKFWLTNRNQDNWRDRSHTSVSGGGGDKSPVGVKDETKVEIMASILSLIQPKPDPLK